jgi:glutamyl-tRNA synthetase
VTVVRTRFAPIPTGFLHLGNIRSALFPWAFARHHEGTFILRIEDTDQERSTVEAERAIVDAMAWLGLDYDEGPYYQMQRMDRYRAVLDDMLDKGLAYRCYTTPAELDELRAEQTARGEKPRYDGRWRPENVQGRAPPAGVAPVFRFRNPDDGLVAWNDAAKGPIEIANAELDDLVIARADRTPTYNFCVVVDDMDMGVTHVIRGDDHISNTPKQIAVYRALGQLTPIFGHVPMIHGPDGKKLSKRHGATAVGDYQHLGILPEAMRNFLALLGWSPGGDREIVSMDELRNLFSLAGILKKPAVFDTTKLEWMNGQYLTAKSAEELYPLVKPELEKLGLDGNRDVILRAIASVKTRSRTTLDVAKQVAVRLDPKFVTLDEKAQKEIAKDPAGYRDMLGAIVEVLKPLDAWTPDELEHVLRNLAQRRTAKAGQVFQPIRIALTGGTVSEPVNELLSVVGKEAALRRLEAASHS